MQCEADNTPRETTPDHSTVAVADSGDTTVLSANPKRVSVMIHNASDTEISLTLGDSSSSHAMPLGSGSRLTLSRDDGCKGAIVATHGGTGDKNLKVLELEA